MKKYYRKRCILRHQEINDRAKYETIDFLFRPSDIYRHIAQPYATHSLLETGRDCRQASQVPVPSSSAARTL